MEESISGFKTRGGWGDAVEHGERITRALHDNGVREAYREPFEAWDEWRPKAHERLGEDVDAKTAEQASVAEGKGEKEGKSPEDDLQTAGEKLSESYERVENGDSDGALDSWKDSIDHVARAADSAGRKAVRKFEHTVYRKVMTQMAPYYFDNELVSANIQKSTRGEQGPEFVFEVNVNDDELKEAVSRRLADYEDEVDRWHVDTPKDVEVAETVEGAEPPVETVEDGTEGRSDPTTN
ncbi:DUF5828 family protein [Halobaculum lipolyticum]|uniref:DUF5828 family protein n=1 Tax=Halobaculum lipolyticum TaxID=3032001 RepID=A0ABD5WD66_9EURY|nr:DUF5828 family protein [Halobaculum sp. DT31]